MLHLKVQKLRTRCMGCYFTSPKYRADKSVRLVDVERQFRNRMFNHRRTGACRMSPGSKALEKKKSQSPATGGISLALNRATTRKRAKRFLVTTDFASKFSFTSLMWSARKYAPNPPGFSYY